jgi:prolipoprotein diacylglyceryltransferase
MMLNGFERFWIERIRVNATYDLFGHQVTQAQLISTALFVGGAALLVWALKRPLPAPLPTELASDELEGVESEDADDAEDEEAAHPRA